MKFSITNKFGNVILLISLIYLHKYKCIFIKKISYKRNVIRNFSKSNNQIIRLF